MTDKKIFDRYLVALRKTPIDDKTEHTDRPALQAFLQSVADEATGGLTVHHETKQTKVKGKAVSFVPEKKAAPDFKITRSGGLIGGYVENKAIGEDLDKVLKSEQLTKYKSLFVEAPNILVTDYLRFVWIGKHGIQREILCNPTELQNPKYLPREENVASVSKLLQGFFSCPPQRIGDSEQLALALAKRSKLLHDYLGEELVRQEREHKEGKLYGLFQIFRDQVFHELTLNEFADAFADVGAIADGLAFTIEQMAKIDKAYKAAFAKRG